MTANRLALRSAAVSGAALIAGLIAAVGGPEVGVGSNTPVGTKPSPEAAKFFDQQVRPILETHCFSCHGGEAKIKGGLRLTTREGVLKGGKNGPIVSREKPDEGTMLDAIHHRNGLAMPPRGKLPQAQIDILARWVKMGVPWAEKTGHETAKHGPPQVDERAKNFWSFKAPVRPAVPAVKNAAWVKNPVDAFILAKLEAAGFAPAPPAEKTALLRRVYYTLVGLPPTPAEVEAFAADAALDAYEKVVDRLLGSRHYGEHQARRWLDLVRWAETNSFERDGPKLHAWKYRDYVISAFNRDKPYNRFVVEQLAGDEIEPVTREGIIATGFHRLGLWDDEPVDREQAYYDQLDDILSTTGQTFLGLTVGCARCHDHKIDPFPQKDYYKLLAFFHGVNSYGNGAAAVRTIGEATAKPAKAIDPADKDAQKAAAKAQKDSAAKSADFEKRMAELNGRLAVIEDAVGAKLTGGEKDDFQYAENRPHILKKHVGGLIAPAEHERYLDLRRQRDELNKNRPTALEQVMAVIERGGAARETFVFTRGMHIAKADKVEPGFPAVITDARPTLPTMPAGAKTSGRRKVAAEWIVDPKNPLAARVMVNRLFQHAFGRGIVRSASNFGYMGTPPTHPELLDWLATELVAKNWSVKQALRTLVTSNAFRMSGKADPAAAAKDPENDLLRFYELHRMSAEEIRDTILAVSGNLNLAKTEGPSVFPTIPAEVLSGQSRPGDGWGKSTAEEQAARSVFVYVKRSLAVPMLAVFDAPDPDSPCAVRFTTTQPTQALIMINGKFMNDQAGVFAGSLVKAGAKDPAAQVALALRRATQRTPTAAEIARGVKLIADMQEKDKLAADEALRRFCLLALNLNEMVYVD